MVAAASAGAAQTTGVKSISRGLAVSDDRPSWLWLEANAAGLMSATLPKGVLSLVEINAFFGAPRRFSVAAKLFVPVPWVALS